MTIDSSSLAAGVGALAQNVVFEVAASNLERKICIIGTYHSSKTAVVDEVPRRLLSAAEAGSLYGFGSMLHRLAVRVFEAAPSCPVYAVPQAEAGGAVAAAGEFDFSASSGVLAGTVYTAVAGIQVPFVVTDAMTVTQIGDAFVAAVTANQDLPITAVNTLGAVTVTAKSKGPWGNDISLAVNILAGQELPTGVDVVITDMASGAGIPTMADALDGLGTGDDANELGITGMVHGYGQDATTLNAISAYVGAGDLDAGLWAKTVARPFRSLVGDVAAGSSGLSDLITLSDGRTTDRASGVIAVPGSYSHPSEIAALTMAVIEKITKTRPEQNYIGAALGTIDPGVSSDRWTKDYANRDSAVKNGVGTTKVENGVVVLQNVISFYRPDSIPVDSNGYRSMRNIALLQNILYNVRAYFQSSTWQGVSIVGNASRVTDPTSRLKVRDTTSVIEGLVDLATAFEGKAWIYEAAFTISKLNESGAVSVRSGQTGFDVVLSLILSGEGGIYDTTVNFDTSIAVLS